MPNSLWVKHFRIQILTTSLPGQELPFAARESRKRAVGARKRERCDDRSIAPPTLLRRRLFPARQCAVRCASRTTTPARCRAREFER